jgi:hypothetical protein
MDHLSFGSGMLFQFKYPLKNQLRLSIYQEVGEGEEDVDPEEIEQRVD